VAASDAAKEAYHLAHQLTELGERTDAPIDVHVDNKSAIDVAYNPEHIGRMKHVDRRHFFIPTLFAKWWSVTSFMCPS
jgi:hypothetical protein